MTDRNIVFFLGAGFSTDGWKLPVMAQFGRSSSSLMNTIHNEWVRKGEPIKDSQPALAKIANSFQLFRDWCATAAHHCSFDDSNLEDLSGMLEILEQSGIDTIMVKNSRQLDIEKLRQQFNQWIWMVYRSCPPFDATQKERYGPNGWPQERFVRSVKKLLCCNTLTFITTNYDIVLEAVAWREGWKLRYPMDSCSYSSLGTTPDAYIAGHQDESAPVLCKLHGSVNFVSEHQNPFDKEACIEVIDTWIRKGDKIGQSESPMDAPSTCPVDSFNHLLGKRKLTAAVVPPTYAKLNAAEWLKQHWGHAFKAMSEATHIVFIGYSLPVSDGFMHSFLRSVLSHRGRHRPPPNVLVIDPNETTLGRYTDFFCGPDFGQNLKTWPKTLEYAIDDLFGWLN